MSEHADARTYQPAPLPADEEARLLDLQQSGLLDSPAEILFDNITVLAAQLLDMPMAFISLVDRHRQWFKSAVGLEASETPRDVAFCAHAILGSQLFVVEQALEDQRFAGNPLVQGEPNIRFYAGMPLRSARGYALGTLCVLDRQPRQLDERQCQVFYRLANMCEALIADRRRRITMDAELKRSGEVLNALPKALFWIDRDSLQPEPLNTTAHTWLRQLELHTPLQLPVWPDRLLISWLLRNESAPQNMTSVLAWLQQQPCTLTLPWLTEARVMVDVQLQVIASGDYLLSVDRKQTLDVTRLRESSAVSPEQLMRVAELGVWQFNLQTQKLSINPVWLQMKGFAPLSGVEVPVEEWRQRVHPEDLQRADALRDTLREGVNGSYMLSFRVQHADGHWVWLQSRGEVLQWNNQGAPALMRGVHADVSSLKTLENKSFHQQQLLNAVFRASIQVSIIATDLQGVITLFSAGAERLLGYSAEEVIGLQTPVIYHDIDEVRGCAEELSVRLGRLIEGFEVFVTLALSAEPDRLWVYITRTGQRLIVRLSLAALYDQEGQISGYLGVAVDLSDQVRAEQRALVHEQRMLQSFRSAAHGIGMVGLDGHWLEVNDALCNMLGYSRTQLLQCDVLSLTHPEDQEFLLYPATTERTAKESYQQQKRYLRADGSTMRGLMSVAALYDEQGDASGYVVQIQDITQQYQAEQELQARAEFQRQLIAQVANAIVSISTQGQILSFNRAAEQLFGYDQTEAIGQNVEILMPESYRLRHAAYLRANQGQAVAQVIGRRRELTALHRDGHEFPVEIIVSQIAIRNEVSFIAVIRDLTEQKQVERMTNEIISTISHELRTPLTSIMGGLGLILGGVMGEVPGEQKGLLEMAQQNGNRLNLLINDLLDIEKLVAGRMEFNLEWLDVSMLIQEALDSHAGYALKHSVVLQSRLHIPGLQIYVDRLRFGQVMANLLSNAIKFSPVQQTVEVHGDCVAEQLRLSVMDRGPGVPAHFRHRLFEKFAQADAGDTRLRGGTGLGLAISRELVRHMKGSIGYEDRSGGGGCFWVNFMVRNKAN